MIVVYTMIIMRVSAALKVTYRNTYFAFVFLAALCPCLISQRHRRTQDPDNPQKPRSQEAKKPENLKLRTVSIGLGKVPKRPFSRLHRAVSMHTNEKSICDTPKTSLMTLSESRKDSLSECSDSTSGSQGRPGLTSEDIQGRRIIGDRPIGVSDPIPCWYGPDMGQSVLPGSCRVQRHTADALAQSHWRSV
jgi:hypothetical protein